MADGPEQPDNPDACLDSLLLTNNFRIDGNRLITSCFYTGPHKTILFLSICFTILTSLLFIEIVLSLEAPISMVATVLLTAILAVFTFRASYLRTMPFEIQIDRSSHQIRITRPDKPDLVINTNEAVFETQARDYFAKDSGLYWLVACLPDKNRVFLADTTGINGAENLRIRLEKWLTAII